MNRSKALSRSPPKHSSPPHSTANRPPKPPQSPSARRCHCRMRSDTPQIHRLQTHCGTTGTSMCRFPPRSPGALPRSRTTRPRPPHSPCPVSPRILASQTPPPAQAVRWPHQTHSPPRDHSAPHPKRSLRFSFDTAPTPSRPPSHTPHQTRRHPPHPPTACHPCATGNALLRAFQRAIPPRSTCPLHPHAPRCQASSRSVSRSRSPAPHPSSWS